MRRERRRIGPGLAVVLAAGALLAAGLLAAGGGVEAASAVAVTPRINGGVEDGTFTPSCLSGKTTAPDTGVLNAMGFRNKLGTVVRVIVPYNIAVSTSSAEYKCLNAYLTDAGHDHAAVELTLDQGPNSPAGPSLNTYTTAVDDLHSRMGGRIAYLTAWNEPNNTSYLNGNDPAQRAGQYYVAARNVFGAKVVAGDFSSGVAPSFLSAYLGPITGAGMRPGIWAIHPYTDVTNFQYYMYDGDSAQKAGQLAAKSSKVLQLADELHSHGYGPGTQLWINEIYVDHNADKNPPPGLKKGAKGTGFSTHNQGYAALFLNGGLGADSLPGVLAGKNTPQLTRYIYLRAWDNGKTLADADVLQVQAPGCVYDTLASTAIKPAAVCE